MLFTFQQSNCVAVGAFNMYIIQPSWLVEQEILPRDVKLKIEFNLTEPGLRFRATDQRWSWVVAPTRLMLQSDDLHDDCGTPVAKVLERLPWTPIKVVGLNSHYSAPLSALEELPTLRDLCHDREDRRPAIHECGYGVSFKEGDRLFSFNLTREAESIKLMCNVQTRVSGRADERCQEAAKMFLADRQRARAMANENLHIRLES